MAPREHRGHCASDGIFAGPILRIDAALSQTRSAGTPDQEAEALADAGVTAEELVGAVHPSLVGNTQGSGMGGIREP